MEIKGHRVASVIVRSDIEHRNVTEAQAVRLRREGGKDLRGATPGNCPRQHAEHACLFGKKEHSAKTGERLDTSLSIYLYVFLG